MTINFRGYVFDDSGAAVSGASVKLLDTGTTTQEGSTATTDSNGLWYFDTVSEADGPFDVEITKGSSVRRIRWNDQIHLKEIDVQNNTGNTTPAATFTNFTNNADNDVAHFRSLRGTGADNDEMYIRYYMDDASSNSTEVARMTVKLISANATSEDSEIRWGVAVGGSIVDVFTISNTDGGVSTFAIDAAGDITLDADGGDVFFKDGGTTFGSATNNSGNLILKSGTTTAATFSGANVTFAGTVDATTDFTLGDTVITDGVITDSTGLQLAANLDIDGTADISGDLTLSGGADGALQFTNAGENSIKIPDNQASALIIEEADNAYITFVTTDSSEAITVAKATTFSAGIANSGTIAAGTWNGTAIASSYIAADAITGAKIADDAIDSEHYTDGSIDTAHLANDAVTNAKIADDALDSEHYTDASIDFAHIQNVAANSILGRNANSSGVLSEVALATTQILIGDGTGFTAAALSGDATMTNAGVVSLAAAQTNVNSLLAANIVIGEDAQTQIDFETANEIHFDADNAEIAKITATGLTMSAGENIYLGDGSSVNIATPLLAGGDHTYSGVTAQMLAGGAISAFNLVCIHTTTQEVVVADASAGATARAIGIAPAAISDTATGTILLHGFVRDDTWNWTTGAVLFLSETAGALTETAPTTDGAFVQAVGIALEPDVVFINPSLDIIEHA